MEYIGGTNVKKFYELLKARYPVMIRGVEEAHSLSPNLVNKYFEDCLGWVIKAYGEESLSKLVEGYAAYTFEVNRAQVLYEKNGAYQFSKFEDVNKITYQQRDYMHSYYWGVLSILFCWSHYVELMEFYLEQFLAKISSGLVLEVAPGHGIWGILALRTNKNLCLEGWDISPVSLEMAPKIARSANLDNRATYHLGDATKLLRENLKYDAAICCFMLEHIEDPGLFLKQFARNLKKDSFAFITLALTAAQVDHIFEFKKESEAIAYAEAAGFELLDAKISRPQRIAANSSKIPRVQALVLRKI